MSVHVVSAHDDNACDCHQLGVAMFGPRGGAPPSGSLNVHIKTTWPLLMTARRHPQPSLMPFLGSVTVVDDRNAVNNLKVVHCMTLFLFACVPVSLP